jgi:hypothetical protein
MTKSNVSNERGFVIVGLQRKENVHVSSSADRLEERSKVTVLNESLLSEIEVHFCSI